MNPPIKDWQGRTVWLVGASSGIGRALASALHARGARVVLSARQAQALQDFVAQHPGSLALPLDASDPDQVRHAAQTLLQAGPIDLVCYLAGYYQPMRASDFDLAQALRHQEVNLSGAWYVLDALLPALLARRAGHISLVSSVAGFRGLPKSLAYGPTKAALINLAETLYLDLHPQGLGVSLINPGFVATPMTAQNDFTMPALITPEQAAAAILQGWAAGDFHIHFPKRFTRLMQLLRLLPYRWYFALVRRGTGL
ncbi:dehydrogenase with different specificities related to short-chain alcohol dehydrogenase [Serpentinimonas raichei]|jgi:NAD(P)-dependent dehydrogenase (short-subunit alcohol dehydrogenase family)|uniref:Dehydrogenase with different specificities related to short-chain alcohol dehydrogenase n=1 Tax=Serpentinimonas raichei TaxID=1458425 RepID=A0A060NGQ3_9BURK|nr:SDR family NAD(P)-dependent oxidoreductase [Serpentinimonas raichei]BAO80152.1 dehydrogenase with different specificities related to short-chain alcohol dehydrogenase [Serpentinimonas raichei]